MGLYFEKGILTLFDRSFAKRNLRVTAHYIFFPAGVLSLNPAVALRGCGLDAGGRDRCQRLAKRPARDAARSDERWAVEKIGWAFCIW